MMFSLLVTAPAIANSNAWAAYHFAKAITESEHSVYRVFFYGDGTYTANALSIAPQDQECITQLWAALGTQHNIDLCVCVSSASRRGIIGLDEAKRHNKLSASIHPAFTIGGLGQLVDATSHSERVVSFG